MALQDERLLFGARQTSQALSAHALGIQDRALYAVWSGGANTRSGKSNLPTSGGSCSPLPNPGRGLHGIFMTEFLFLCPLMTYKMHKHQLPPLPFRVVMR